MVRNQFSTRHVLIASLLGLALSACGSLHTPQLKTGHFNSATDNYVPQEGEYITTRELYKSDEVLKINSTESEEGFRLQWPVSQVSMSRGFLTGAKEHFGLDLTGRKGTKIMAAHKGTVIYAGSGFRGYGKMVLIEYNENWATLYGHLSRIYVKAGKKVKAGQTIGLMGRTGRATGVHLHFELMHNKIPVDPLPLLGSIGQISLKRSAQ